MKKRIAGNKPGTNAYEAMLGRVVQLIDESRRVSARAVNAVITATYWLVGWHIVEFEQRADGRRGATLRICWCETVENRGRFLDDTPEYH